MRETLALVGSIVSTALGLVVIGVMIFKAAPAMKQSYEDALEQAPGSRKAARIRGAVALSFGLIAAATGVWLGIRDSG